ncbi:MAG TPA: carboxypeptidase regulatory-like domain-containing protein [Gemmatimonadaceae bacterium]
MQARTVAGTQPLAGAFVWAWVQMETSGYSRGRVETDASGNYRISDLPPARVLLQAWSAGYDQPCASLVELTTPTATADIDLVAESNPVLLPEPPAPALYGVVYQPTATGKQPVPGARVYFETAMDLVAATTTTDEQGRYTLCRLPALSPLQAVTPVKAGYVTRTSTVSVSGVTRLDLEMERQ